MSARIPVHLPPPTTEERNLATLAQVFGLLGYLTLFGQVACPLVMYFAKRDESPFVAFHALQTALFHLVVTVGLSVMGVVGVVLSIVLIGIPILIAVGVFTLLALILSIAGCISAYRGQWSRYPIVGGWALPKAPTGASA